MLEYWRRLTSVKRLAWEVIAISIVINILGLASSIYSIQVLNRYLALGIDSTLVTLTIGVLLVIALEIVTRSIRLKIVQWVCLRADKKLSEAAFKLITSARYSAISSLPIENRREALSGLNTIQTSYSAQNLISVIDSPFALFFLVVIFTLNANIAAGLAVLMTCIAVITWLIYRSTDDTSKDLSQSTINWGADQNILSNNIELIRAFNIKSILEQSWNKSLAAVLGFRKILIYIQNMASTSIYSATALLTVIVYSIGSIEVMAGNLDVGSLIGISILASRALNNLTKILQLVEPIKRGERALESLGQLYHLNNDSNRKMKLSSWSGGLIFEDFAFGYSGQAVPVFESFNAQIKPGTVVCVKGSNGTGKTTLSRLLVGLIDPTRGWVKADGMDLRHADTEWWQGQIMYAPQELTFFNASIRDNITLCNDHLSDVDLANIIQLVDLNRFLDHTPEGLFTKIVNNGNSIPIGVKRRISLARALSSQGQLVIFDEPTEALDLEGLKSLAGVLSYLSRQKKTIIVMSNEDFIVKASDMVIDLNSKPTPDITYKHQESSANEVE